MSQLHPALSDDLPALIARLTGFDEDEENFGLCMDFAVSNLLYHNRFDPEERAVFQWMDGLREKLWVHAERDKARDLDTLLDRYKNDPVWRERHEQHDVKVRILSLLEHLSDSALKSEWGGMTEVEEDEPEVEAVDWRALLAEGEEEWRPGREEELSDWTDDEGEEEEEEEDEAKEPPPPRLLMPPGLWSLKTKDLRSVDELAASVAEKIQPQYWKTERCQPHVDSDDPANACFSSRVDALMRAAGVNTVAKVTLSEYQLLREVLWSLRNPSPSTVFEVDAEGRFRMRENVCLPSVTAGALNHAADSICRLMDHLRVLLDFCQSVFAEQRNLDSTVPFTYEAYSSSLGDLLQMFFADLLCLEKTVSGQEETFTLFNLLGGLGDWPKVISKLHNVHVGIIYRSQKELQRNWQKAIALLSGLHDQIAANSNQLMHDLFLNVYLKTIQPYLRIVGLWLAEGRLEDYRDEFVFAHKSGDVSDRESESFWTDGIEVRDYRSFLTSADLRLPQMWESTLDEVLVSGKSVEILTILRKKRVITANDKLNLGGKDLSKDLSQEFLKQVRQNLPSQQMPVSGAGDCDVADAVAEERPKMAKSNSLDPKELDIDPYLAMAFAEVVNASSEDTVDAPSSNDSFYLVKNVDPFQPASLIMARCLENLVNEFYRTSCDALSKLILRKLDLQHHLGSIRRVFLMEAGDLLFEFYSELFRRLRDGLDLDSTSLTLFLQDCLGRRYPHEETDRFTLELPPDGENLNTEEFISKIRLKYEVDWPLSIILGSRTLVIYNQVFLFLLEVKRALWSLRQIQAKELIRRLVIEEGKHPADEEDDDDSLSPSLRMHRVLLLRSWLLHFVGNVHAYFMSRVLHTTELELREALAHCVDLDQILAAHSRHLARVFERCFLHPSARVLREAVARVLAVCHRLGSLCARPEDVFAGDAFERALESCEETYARSHQFLSSTLTSMTQRRNVPHLDGLAAALAHSCPATRN